MKLHQKLAESHACSVYQTLYIPISSAFGANVIPQNGRCLHNSIAKIGTLEVLTRLTYNSAKNNALIDLMKLPKDDDKCPHLLAQEIVDRINKGIIVKGKRVPTQNSILADDNLLVDTWKQLKPALACIIESSIILLGEPAMQLRQSPMYIYKHSKTMHSYLHVQIVVLFNSRNRALIISDNKRQDLVKIISTT